MAKLTEQEQRQLVDVMGSINGLTTIISIAAGELHSIIGLDSRIEMLDRDARIQAVKDAVVVSARELEALFTP